MLILIMFMCLVTNISVIKCNNNNNGASSNNGNAGREKRNNNENTLTVELLHSDWCKVDEKHTIPNGTNLLVNIENKSNNILDKYSFEIESLERTIPNIAAQYKLFFKFTYKRDGQNNGLHPMCNTTVLFESKPIKTPEKNINTWHLYVAIGAVVAGIITIALAATTMYYRRQFILLRNESNLIMKTDKSETDVPDIERYCSGPRKGKSLDTINDRNRDSDIYEDPKITLGVNRIPPALPTSPRPKRNNLDTLKTSSPSLTLKSNSSAYPTFPRSKVTEREAMSMANRPPLPLPQEEVYTEREAMSMANRPPLPLPQEEVYTDALEEDLYEAPPVPERPPLSTLPKSSKQDKIGKQIPEKPRLENIFKPKPEKIVKPKPDNCVKPKPENSMNPKSRNMVKDKLENIVKPKPDIMIRPKPENVVKPTTENIVKPRAGTLAKAFEEKFGNKLPADSLKPSGMKPLLKPAVPQDRSNLSRNKVVQVPVREIPDTSSNKKPPFVKPKPNPTPKTPPATTFEQEVQLFDEKRHDIPKLSQHDSSDEEWEYEDLPQFRIYNI